jgi:hypothetical protein
MGNGTAASGEDSTAMGYQTKASGISSTAMGSVTTASAPASTAIGYQTIASGSYSTAMGSNVSTNGHAGSFIYGDASHSGTVNSSANNEFMVVASGGTIIYSNTAANVGAYLPPGSGSWGIFSDRNAKTAVRPVDAREVLEKVAAMPMATWQYKAQDPQYRHMGPMAQDFYAAFGLGEADTRISTVDGQGVALAAIQGLNAKLTDKDAEIAALKREFASANEAKDRAIAKLRDELAAQHAFAATLAGDMAVMKAQFTAKYQTAPALTTAALNRP